MVHRISRLSKNSNIYFVALRYDIIDIGKSIFGFDGNFYLDDAQVIIRGNGSSNTEFHWM